MERKRTAAPEMDEAAEKRRKVDSDFDLHRCPPSKVVHVRAVPDGSTQYDMMAAVQQFGKVRSVRPTVRVPNYQQRKPSLFLSGCTLQMSAV